MRSKVRNARRLPARCPCSENGRRLAGARQPLEEESNPALALSPTTQQRRGCRKQVGGPPPLLLCDTAPGVAACNAQPRIPLADSAGLCGRAAQSRQAACLLLPPPPPPHQSPVAAHLPARRNMAMVQQGPPEPPGERHIALVCHDWGHASTFFSWTWTKQYLLRVRWWRGSWWCSGQRRHALRAAPLVSHTSCSGLVPSAAHT